MNTKAKGDRTEAEVLCRLVKLTDTVLMPFGENQGYDMVFDLDGRLYRVQCKTGTLNSRTQDTISFSTSSTYKVQGELVWKSLSGECDFFGVHCPELDQVWLVPSSEVGAREATLRLRGGGSSSRMAEDYEAQKVIASMR